MSTRITFSVLLAASSLFAAVAASGPPPKEIELDEARVFIEFNATDEDIGIQFFWDGDDWDRMSVYGPGREVALRVKAHNALKLHGLTEAFFESAEPPLEELSLEEFFERFPEGEYEFEGQTLEGHELEGEADFSHTLPAAPQGLRPGQGAVVDPTQPLLLSFQAVTTDLQGQPLTPQQYEIVLEHENGLLRVLSMTVEGSEPFPSMTVPPQFLKPGEGYKLEVIVQADNGNRTISEVEFQTR
jgi:hypothetical protein